MITLTVNVNTSESEAAVKRLADLEPAMKVVATRLYTEVMENFEKGGVFPQPWPKSMRVIRKGGQTLVDKGILRRSFTAGRRWGADFAEIGSDVKYAAIHQYGGMFVMPSRTNAHRTTGRFMSREAAGKAKKAVRVSFTASRTVTMPARPMLPVDAAGNLRPETEQYVRMTIQRYVSGTA